MSCTRKNNFYLEYSTFIWRCRDSLQLSIKSNHNYIVFISLLCNWFRTLQKDSKLEQILTWLLQFFSPGSFLIFTLIFQASFLWWVIEITLVFLLPLEMSINVKGKICPNLISLFISSTYCSWYFGVSKGNSGTGGSEYCQMPLIKLSILLLTSINQSS